jgi:hypothetical protein
MATTTTQQNVGVWAFSHSQLGVFYVRANDPVSAQQAAANATRDPVTGSTSVVADMNPDGSGNQITDIKDMLPGQIYDVRNGRPVWKGNWREAVHKDWFNNTGNWKYNTGGSPSVQQSSGDAAGKDGTNKSGFSQLTEPDAEETGFLETADNVAGFLKGLGYDIGAAGPGGASDFRLNQGYLGLGNYNAGEAADYFRAQSSGIPGEYRLPDADFQRFGSDVGSFGGIGTTALKNLATLGSLSNSDLAAEGAPSRFATPLTAADNSASYRNDISNLLSAAFQGAGVSSQFLGRGVSTGDIGRLYSQYAANDPGLNVGGAATQDDSFLKYVAQQYGLNNFFNQTTGTVNS